MTAGAILNLYSNVELLTRDRVARLFDVRTVFLRKYPEVAAAKLYKPHGRRVHDQLPVFQPNALEPRTLRGVKVALSNSIWERLPGLERVKMSIALEPMTSD